MNDNSFLQDDDISILLGEDDMNAVSPHVIPVFNFTASRHQLPTASGITSMEALRNAYEELKKKYNDLNFKYHTLLRLAPKSRASELPDELRSVSHSLEEEPKIIQINRKDEIENLHKAILRLNYELSEEKEKNIKLQMQINSYKEKPYHSHETEKSDKSLNILEELKENIDMLEKSVEFHKAIISKQCMHLDNQTLFGKTDFISQRKQQSEHDELSSLGNKPGRTPPRAPPSTAATVATAVTTKKAQNASDQHISNDVQKGSSIIDLKGTRQKQDQQKDLSHAFASRAPPLPNLCTNALPSSSSHSSSSSSSSSTTITTTPTTNTTTTTTNVNALIREKDSHYLNNTETVSSGETSKPFSSLTERICPICEEPFLDLSKFQEHVFYCKYDPSPDRTCPVCMKSFINAEQKQFEQHVHAHFDQTLEDFEMF